MTLRIYPASSWRNKVYAADVAALRADNHEVFDFRTANSEFRWPSCATLPEYIRALEADPQVAAAFERDKTALDWCEVCVLILPCGRSAHLEAMYASAQGKLVVVKLDPTEPLQPELMYKLLAVGAGGARYVTSTAELLAALRTHEQHSVAERALALSRNDIARAVEILREWTGVSFDTAFALIDEVAALDEPRAAAPTTLDSILLGYRDAQSRILAARRGGIALDASGNHKGTKGEPAS
jgi:hypothetical protein